MEFAIAKLSTKGQIVIPSNLRKDIHAGEEFLIVKNNGNFILKKMSDIAKGLKDDLQFAKHVEKAWKDYDSGKFKSMNKKDFIEELKSW